MATLLDSMPRRDMPAWWNWLPLAGLLALYLPTFFGAATSIWESDANAHGPLILAVVLWLSWQLREKLVSTSKRPATVVGSLTLFFGLLVYFVGRSQHIWLLDIGSLIPVVGAVLLLTHGWATVRTFWFPLLFIIFMLPMPGPLVDALTGPLKQVISVTAEEFLYALGYPIARVGVTLSIGQYQLLVADACSGLHSMFSLSALGTLYLYLMQHQSRLRNGLILALIIPIAIAANILRVIVLVLVTYYFGDAAGQGFVHGFAGMILFVAALLLLTGIDSALGFVGGHWLKQKKS